MKTSILATVSAPSGAASEEKGSPASMAVKDHLQKKMVYDQGGGRSTSPVVRQGVIVKQTT